MFLKSGSVPASTLQKRFLYQKSVLPPFLGQKKNFTEIMGISQSSTNEIMESPSEYSVGCDWTGQFGSGSPSRTECK